MDSNCQITFIPIHSCTDLHRTGRFLRYPWLIAPVNGRLAPLVDHCHHVDPPRSNVSTFNILEQTQCSGNYMMVLKVDQIELDVDSMIQGFRVASVASHTHDLIFSIVRVGIQLTHMRIFGRLKLVIGFLICENPLVGGLGHRYG